MTTQIHEKTASALVIEPSGAIRQLLVVTLKKFGFANVTGVSDLKDALGVMEAEPFDWIITSLFKDEKINGLHLLPILASKPILKNTRISIFFEESEHDCLLPAYEKGLFCHFNKPFNKESLLDEVTNHFNKYEELEWDDTRFAAYHIFSYLKEVKKFELLEEFSMNMLKIYPGDITIMLELAHAQIGLEQEKKAQTTLRQAFLLDNKSRNVISKFIEENFSEPFDFENASGDEKWDLGIEEIYIVDPDQKSRSQLEQILGDIGVENIKSYEDPEAAWQELESSDLNGIMILEWGLPNISGAIFSQRIRKKNPCTPLIVLSSDLTEDDQIILKEIGIEKIIKKPLEKQELISTIIGILRQERIPTDVEMIELKIKQLLEAKKYEDAVKLKDQFMSNQSVPEYRRKKILADFSYYEGNFQLARDLAIEVIKNQSDSIALLNFIGKCLMKLGDLESSLACFKKAQEMSPQNIERLCNIAVVSQETGNNQQSHDAMEKAKSLDSKNQDVVKTDASLKISSGKTQDAQNIMKDMESLTEIISFMNNKAIALAKNGMVEESIDTYKQTLHSIPENKSKYKAAVSYNLALAYIRSSQLQPALDLLAEAFKIGSKPLQRKAKSLEARIKRAIANGSEIALKQQQNNTTSSDQDSQDASKDLKSQAQDHLQIVATINANPGELCCYRVFASNEPISPEVQKLFKDPPRFNPRSAIAKEESAGLEKTMHRGKKMA